MTIRFTTDQIIPRLDRHLADLHPAIPRSKWDTWIREGHVRVNGQPVTKAGTRLRVGDAVETELPEVPPPGFHLEPQAMDVPTLFEDDRLWIVDKPSGLVVHPGPGHPDGTLVNALLARFRDRSLGEGAGAPEGEEEDEETAPGAAWPGLVHRLDRYTSGCLAMAKDASAQACLQAQFKARTVDKRYLALCRMSRKLPELGSLLVDEPIARHRVERMKMTIAAHGRSAQTRVRVLAKAAGLALVECELMTGRTHQIRLHLGHLGAPILGDPLYGGATKWQDGEKRPFTWEHPALHAWKLSLDHPDGRRLALTAPLPEPYRALLERLGITAP